jgi:hypothetical protein
MAHDPLFELALTRARSYLQRARVPLKQDEAGLLRQLEVWALKTRFASRVDLVRLARVLHRERSANRTSNRDAP